jgi:type I restriction-modification system DNA methylase subunit
MTKKKHEILDGLHDRAEQFSTRFSKAHYESGDAQNFMRSFCDIYEIDWASSIKFEERIPKEGDAGGINRIDGFLPRLMLIEMKSAGKDLAAARNQAFDYIQILKRDRPQDVPQYVLVSDFQHLHLYDRNKSENEPIKIHLAEFRQHVEQFDFLLGYENIVEQRQEEVNIHAAEKLAALNEAIKKTGYGGKDLETLLVRILFCMFAEDTGLFTEPNLFTNLINNTRTDGRDLYGTLDQLFIALDTKERSTAIYPEFRAFPYVNGNLFTDRITPCYFESESRTALLACAAEIDWSQISPSIFGSLFQAIMHFDDEAEKKKAKSDKTTKDTKRREFGAHYTSERNILKTIKPLFLDKLKKELDDCKGDANKLDAFLYKLSQIRLFDPACGCGNFLVVAYREIRILEEKALAQLSKPKKGQAAFHFPVCNVNQCYGIEIDPSAVEIATVALWLVDHQMNMRVKHADGTPYIRLPLTAKANIVCGNALQLDWNSVIPVKDCSYVMGNPPFIGKAMQNEKQKAELSYIFHDIKGAGVLDYVSCWYRKAAEYIVKNPLIKAAFVSTNSITQGEQVGVLWPDIFKRNIKLHFAHRTFRWNNEGKGVAAVHCVIIGFGLGEPKQRIIFDYADIKGDPTPIKAKNINPYLVDASNVVLQRLSKPLCDVPSLKYGSKPVDGGALILNQEERNELLILEPQAKDWIRSFIGADEFLNNIPRYCLWLVGASPSELSQSPLVMSRIESVKKFRQQSKKAPTMAAAQTPTLFTEIRQGNSPYLAIPEVSSELRNYLPIAYISADVIASNKIYMLSNASPYHLGVLSSAMHNSWMRAVTGRLKSDYQYSAGIVYNNFPWPEKSTKELNDDVDPLCQDSCRLPSVILC